jgi:hypothetical protein
MFYVITIVLSSVFSFDALVIAFSVSYTVAAPEISVETVKKNKRFSERANRRSGGGMFFVIICFTISLFFLLFSDYLLFTFISSSFFLSFASNFISLHFFFDSVLLLRYSNF